MTEEPIFHAALERTDPADRAAFLNEACAGDRDLRCRVESLLRSLDRAGDFLETAPVGIAPPPLAAEGVGSVIGPYKLLEPIGEGGMGVVYMGEQNQPVRRKVALKIIKPGMDTKQVIARFEAERQALALMDHPNIARVLDGGATDSGRPYFVMDLVRGVPITDYCDRHQLSIPERLDLFVQVCHAVQHAHQKGIIHRDLKPTNVLITRHDGVPIPKVIDFGIAKATGQQTLTDKTLFTGFAQVLGTPLYMSPEQAELSGIDVDTRSDIYSLGVLLYELLTGTTPFDPETLRAVAFDEVRRIIREQEPPTPSTRLAALGATQTTVSVNRRTEPHRLNRSLRGELDWITMKALEKDRRRRYETAGAFADDLRRFRAHQPVLASPPSAWYRLRKFARRHRTALTMMALVITMAAIAAGVWGWSVARLRRVDRALKQSRSEARRWQIETEYHQYAADIRQAHQLIKSGQGPRALALLNKWRPAAGGPDTREFTWFYLMRLCHDERRSLRGHAGAVYHAEFAPDGRTVATCGKDGTVRFWDVASGDCLRVIHAHDTEVNWVAYAPDGQTFATVGDDGAIKFWDAEHFDNQATIPAHLGDAIVVRFTPDGRRLISGGRDDGLVKVWDVATRQKLASVRAHDRWLENVVLSPDGTALATIGCTGEGGSTLLWDLPDLCGPRPVFAQHAPLYGVAFSSDGTRLAVAGASQEVHLLDLPGGQLLGEFRGHTLGVQSLAFLPNDRVVSAGEDGAVRLWDAATGRCLGTLLGHADKIWGVSVSPDGATLATASSDGAVKLWDARPPRDRIELLPTAGVGALDLAFAPGGRTLVVARAVGAMDFSPEFGYRFATADLEAFGFDARTGARQFYRVLDREQPVTWFFLTSDGAIAVFMLREGKAAVWEVATGKRLATLDPRGGELLRRPCGRSMAVFRPGQPITLLDAATGRVQDVLAGTESLIAAAAFSPAGTVLAAVDQRNHLRLWNAAEKRSRRLPAGLASWNWEAIAFSPDGTILALSGGTPSIRLWDVRTLEPLGSLPGHANMIQTLVFSPDGRTLASCSRDRVMKLWDVRSHQELLTFESAIGPVQFAPDGRAFAFAGGPPEGERSIYVLTTALPEELAAEESP